MKSMKGILLKKLKTVKSIGYLKPERVLHVHASDGYSSPPKPSGFRSQSPNACTEDDMFLVRERSFQQHQPEIIDVSELMRDLENDEIKFDEKENIIPETKDENRGILESDDGINDKENIRPETGDEKRGFSVAVLKTEKGNSETVESRFGETRICPLSELDVSNFRRPDLDSGSLFDPNLLAAFEQAVTEFKAQEAERRAQINEKVNGQYLIGDEPPFKARKIDENRDDPLLEFEEKCPPGGSDSVILYTTSLRSIRKTFEDCHSIRFLLESFRVLFLERDISMHSEFREELWRIMGKKLVPPCLFIRGRYIGGAERVLGLHEQGKFRHLFEGIPIDWAEGPCDGCGGARFVVCFSCNGSNKVVVVGDEPESCPECNENGLIICPICC